MTRTSEYPDRLTEIITDFQWCEGREKLELLLEYAERLPPLPDWLLDKHESMRQVHECMTPVFVYSTHEGPNLKLYFDVPPESPTVRGFASILADAFDETTPEQILQVPGDFYLKMGLQDVLSGQRLHGIGAIFAQIKKLALEAMET